MANHADETLTASDLVMHIKKARRAIAHLACEFDGAPDTIRTYDTRFRRAVLYPLSYGGIAICKRTYTHVIPTRDAHPACHLRRNDRPSNDCSQTSIKSGSDMV